MTFNFNFLCHRNHHIFFHNLLDFHYLFNENGFLNLNQLFHNYLFLDWHFNNPLYFDFPISIETIAEVFMEEEIQER